MCRVIVSEQDNWKNGIKKYGRQFNDILDVYQDEESLAGSFQDVILGTFTQGDINKVQYSCDSNLFKSDMGKLVVDINKSSSNFNLLEKGKLLRYRQQLLNDDGSVLATADYKFFIITEIEEQKDKKSVLVTCYDHLIKAMQDYVVPKKRSTDRTFQDNKLYFQLTNGKYVKYTGARTGDPFVLNLYENNLTYPITISNYLSKIMTWLYLGYTTSHVIQATGINWGPKNTNLEIEKEHYLDSDSNSLGYTFRDVLDDIAECMGGRIQMQYDLVNGYWKKNFSISGVVRDYGIIFNEEMLNDKNVNMGELYTPNVIVLSRANDSDNIYYPAILPQNPVEVKISDNPILEQDNRGDFIQGIYENINGLSFHINDLATKGISANEIGDWYSVIIDNVSYPCLMLSDDMIRSTGLKENIKTPEPKQSVTDYKYASYSDKVAITSKNAKILVDKANASIEQIVEAVGDNGEVTTASIVQSINDSGSQIKLNADKVYINGVTFDQNQKMTITDGDIDIIDNGTRVEENSHIILHTSDDKKKNYLTSNVINMYEETTIGGTDYTAKTYIYPAYSSFSFIDENNSVDRHTTLDYTNLYASLTRNNINQRSIVGPQVIKTEYDGNTTFNVDVDTGDTTINGKLIIQKDGEHNKGLYDNAGNPIIRDWQNNNVSVDATGGNLYLGYRNTTGINFLDGKANLYSDGDLRLQGRYTWYKAPRVASGDYWKLANIPATSNDNACIVNIRGIIGNWTDLKGEIDVKISNRGELKAWGFCDGPTNLFTTQKIVIYKESDNSHTIYLKSEISYTGPDMLEIIYGGSSTTFPTIYTDKPVTTSPSGTKVWETNNSTMKRINGTILYENNSGTQSNVTLNDTIANYDYIEVFFRNGWIYSSAKGNTMKNNSVAIPLTITYGTGTNNVTIHSAVVQLQGTSLQWYTDRYRDGSIGSSFGTSNPLYITKVVGHIKY